MLLSAYYIILQMWGHEGHDFGMIEPEEKTKGNKTKIALGMIGRFSRGMMYLTYSHVSNEKRTWLFSVYRVLCCPVIWGLQ